MPSVREQAIQLLYFDKCHEELESSWSVEIAAAGGQFSVRNFIWGLPFEFQTCCSHAIFYSVLLLNNV